KLPSSIVLKRYIIIGDNTENNPKKFRIYGSTDGITWVQLDDVYLTTKYNSTQREVSNFNSYLYYCITINAIFPNAYFGDLYFRELQLYDIDDPEIRIYSSTNKTQRIHMTDGNTGTSLNDGFIISKFANNDCSI
ncbi:MAG: hypothetical protein ACK56I_09310, partial [bacterium]